MKSITRRSPKKKIYLAITGIVFVAGIACFWLYSQGISFNQIQNTSSSPSDSTTDSSPATIKEQEDAGKVIKQNEVDSNTPPEVLPDGSIKVEMPQPTVSSNTLRVQSIIHKVTSKGACTLLLSQSGQSTKTYSAGVQPLPSYSTCKGFSVPVPGTGTWTVELRYSNGSESGSVKTNIKI